tara:strand:+ start:183 stop:1232 length:1050 start_codon:yes stop_codon:yes gene_type:complete
MSYEVILLPIILSLFFCWFFSLFASKFKLIDQPNERKIHPKPTPLVGGLSIFLTIYVFSIFYPPEIYIVKVILYVSFFVLIVGLIDDALQLGIRIRLILQIFSSLLVMGAGLVIVDLGNYSLFDGVVRKVIFFDLQVFSLVLTLFAIVGLTNATNFIDGIDGLSSLLTTLAFVFIFLFSYFDTGKTETILLSIIIFSNVGFVILNMGFVKNKKIFLGDAGSMTLGFLLACLLIYYAQYQYMHPVLTLWCVPIVIFDLLGVIIRRVLKKENPFVADRRHIHHLLLDIGYSQKLVLFLILFFSILISISGYLVYFYISSDISLVLFGLYFILYVFVSQKINLLNKNRDIKK